VQKDQCLKSAFANHPRGVVKNKGTGVFFPVDAEACNGFWQQFCGLRRLGKQAGRREEGKCCKRFAFANTSFHFRPVFI